MKHSNTSIDDVAPSPGQPRIRYISDKAKGVYANILLDDWFKRTFEELHNCGRALTPEATVPGLTREHKNSGVPTSRRRPASLFEKHSIRKTLESNAITN